ncbi:calcium-binding protein [Pseudomethylobacillus aquaticus]|uniref:Calcium-binding protein n=1 Tax=Pseudomethylobacillus aquaticus TaxID=2676064 RepID=A0A3N0V6K3_9PROT|nr:calcium-binding protein [Pseudomethylobacillus aquaticus]ROH88427.1 calcium-binding protein [Pseudomethylobacillus aquaticus]
MSLNMEAIISLLQVETGLGNITQANDNVGVLNNIAQTLAAAADLARNPIGVIAANGGALLVTLGKIQIDAKEGKLPSGGDLLSAAGNLATMGAALGVIVSPQGNAAKVFAWTTAGIGGSQLLAPLLVSDASAETLAAARAKFGDAKATTSPIILDLDGDGVETKAVNQGTWFDHDGNGFAESTGWVGKDDGLLVRDVDGSGYIDTGRELFGNNTLLSNGQLAANGFEALKDLDAVANGGNADGKLDSGDVAWASLQVWKDANGDGYHSDGEVISLEEAGVQSINLSYANSTAIDVNGNAHKQLGSFTRADGSTGHATDVWFGVDKMNAIAEDWVEVSPEVASLPYLRGYGQLHDLHQAIMRDSSGELKALVEAFADPAKSQLRNEVFTELLYKWAGVDDIAASSRGPNIDARQLVFMEKLFGEQFVQGAGNGAGGVNPATNSAGLLRSAFNDVFNYFSSLMLLQTHLKDVVAVINYDFESTEIDFDFTDVFELMNQSIAANQAKGVSNMVDFANALKFVGLSDEYTTVKDYFVLQDPAFEGYFSGNSKAIVLNDDGGIIQFTGGYNHLVSGMDEADMVRLYNMGGSAVNLALGSGDNIVTNGIYSSSSNTPYKDFGGIANITVTTGAGNDVLHLFTGNHIINAGDGNDNISFANGLTIVDAGEGANTITGGTGDHSVVTGAGNDGITLQAGNQTVHAGEGDNNVILIGTGARLVETGMGIDTVRLYNMAGSPVILNLGNSNNTVTNGIYSSTSNTPYKDFGGIANITVTTGAGNDVLHLFAGNHLINAGGGDDQITFGNGFTSVDAGEGDNIVTGGTGDHVVLAGAGDDAITLQGGAQKIVAGSGNNIIKLYQSGDRQITAGDGADAIRLYNMGGSSVNLALGNGDNTVTNGIYSSSSSTPHKDYGGSANITVTTGAGNDVLHLFVGNHFINAGAGNDNISFGNGLTSVDAGEGSNIVTGGTGDHTVVAGVGNDAITLQAGNQSIQAGEGNNNITLIGAGARLIEAGMGSDTVRLYNMGGSSVNLALGSGDNVVTNGIYSSSSSIPYKDYGGLANLAVTTGAGNDVLHLFAGNHSINAGAGNDNISFGNGIANVDAGEGNNVITGGTGNHSLVTGAGNDAITLQGGIQAIAAGGGDNQIKLYEAGDRQITAGDGADAVRLYNMGVSSVNLALGDGDNTVTNGIYSSSSSIPLKDYGGSANIAVTTGAGNDVLQLYAGNHIINAGAGDDNISFGNGKAVIYVGDGNDIVTSGSGNSLLIGARGNDTFTTGNGFDVISFNKGDGQDIINASVGADNTLSLGGSIDYSELSLSKVGSSLILKVGDSDQLTFKDWYLATSNKSIVSLQVITDSLVDFELSGTDALRNNKVEIFNFASLVSQFDADIATNSVNATNWSLTDQRLVNHLQSGSDTEVVGGDLAYLYGINGSLGGMAVSHVNSLISENAFGQIAQLINISSLWQSEELFFS